MDGGGLRRDPGPAPRDRGRDQSPGARRRRHRRHDRHARGVARARDRPASTRRSRWWRTTPRAAATASTRSRWTRSRRFSTRPWGACAASSRSSASSSSDPRSPAHGRSAPLAEVAARARSSTRRSWHELLHGHARHHGASERRRPRRAADRRAAARGDLRREIQPALSRHRRRAGHGADQPGADAALRRDGGGLGRLPVGAGDARLGAALAAACATRVSTSTASRFEREVEGFHARVVQHEVRPPRRRALPDAHPRLHALRLQRSAVSRPGRCLQED